MFNKNSLLSFCIGIIFLLSCSPFHPLAKWTMIDREKGYAKVYNDSANIKTLTFGDFEFAYNCKNYRQMHPKKAEFKNILFYAKTYDPEYDYYVLLNPDTIIGSNENYRVADNVMNGERFVIIVSTKAPRKDQDFIIQEVHPNR